MDVYLYAVQAELDKSSCSHLREDGKLNNSEKLLLLSVDLFHPSHGFSRYIKSISYFFDLNFYCDILKECENLMFFLFSFEQLSAKDPLATFSMSTS